MKLIHTGLAASSEENADRFFVDILGLEKSGPTVLDKKLTQAIFGIHDDFLIMHYRSGTVHYEILVYREYKAPERPIAHSCIQVDDFMNVVSKSRKAGLKVVQVPKGSGVVTFISDYDGNLFEVKE